MRNSATPPSVPRFASRRSPAAVPLRGGRLTKVDGEVASFAPSLGKAAPALLSCTSIAGALTGAFLALTAQEARAACTESAGVWTCTGVVTAAQSVKRSGSAISVNLDSGFDMDVAQGVGFTLEQSGAGGIAFVQAAGGQEIVGHSGAVHATNSGAGDISVTATGALGKTGRGAVVKIVNSDASGGSVSVSVGSVSGLDAGGHAIQVTNSGSGTTAVTASGSIISGSGQGDGVNVQTGGGSGSVSVSVATVTGQRTGVRVSHSGSGSVSVSAVGTVEADGGYGGGHAVYVANRGSDASISVAVAAVSAQRKRGAADGIHVLQMHGGAVTVTASGSVSSAGRHGIFVDLRRQGGTPGQKARGDVNIRVSGSVTGGGGSGDAAIKVNSSGGDDARVVLGSGAVVGRAGEDGIVDSSGNALVEVKAGAALRGDVRLGSGDDALSIADGAAVSGEVDLGDGADTVTVSGAEVSSEIFLGDGSDTLTVSGGAALVGYAALGDGDDLLTVTDGSKVSGGVALWNGDDRATVSDGAEVSNHMGFGYGSDTLIVSGAKVSGDVDFGHGSDTMVVSEAAEVSGGLDFGDGGDTLTIGDGAKVSGEVNFGSGGDSFNFGPGFSEVSKAVRGAERFTFESGAVAHIVDTGKADMSGLASLEIKGGAIAILDNAGHRHKVGSILLKPGGTLNIADGVAGTKGINYPHVNNAALLLGHNQEFNGTLIIDANFAQSWGDALAWDGAGTRNWRGTVLIEPAVLAGRQGGTAIITNNLSASQIRVPDGFSVFYDNVWQQLAVRQDMADGGCTDAGSGVFACSDLIHKTQSFSSSGGALAVALGSASVVHALAGTQQGLSLRQSGVGGISLTQSAAGGRIAAAGHAIHVRNSGAGVVSISVAGAVVGGLTGRVADAGGIVAEGGADGGGVRISAASVTGLLHGISASGGGGVSIEAAGSVIGRLGDGVAVESGVSKGFAIKGSVSVSVATVTGGRAGVRVVHRGDGSVSVRADGAVSASGGHGDSHAISVKAHGLDSSIAVVAGTVAAHGTGAADGIHVRQPHRGSVTVSASGAVSSAGRHGVFVDQRSRGRNMHGSVRIGVSGSVTGAAAAIRVESDNGDSVRISLESGAVVGRAGEVGILESRGSAVVDVKNGAAVKGGVELGAGDDTLTVSSATVSDKLDLSVGSDTLTVRDGAAVSGGIDLGTGDDTLTVSSATVSGDVDPGAGDDTLIFSSATVSGKLDLSVGGDKLTVSDGTTVSGGVEMFDGADILTVSNNARVSGGVNLGAGDDTLTVSSATVSGDVNPGAGDDTLIFSSATISGKLDLSVGSDTLTVSDGTQISGGVEMFDGTDILTVSNNARVSGGVDLGDGNDTLAVRDGAEVVGRVELRDDNDTLIVSNATVSGDVAPGDGNDTVNLGDDAKVTGRIDFHYGNDTLIATDGAIIFGTVTSWYGEDTMTVSDGAKIIGVVDLSMDNDTLIVSDGGEISGTVYFNVGNDTATIRDGARVSGGMDFSAGDDILTVSSATVSGGVSLWVGNDTMTVSDGAKVSGHVDLDFGNDKLTVSDGAKVSGGVSLSDGDDKLIVISGAAVSGGVHASGGENTLTFSSATVSGLVSLSNGSNTLTASEGATISGDVIFSSDGDNTVTLSGGAKASSGVMFSRTGDGTVALSGGAKISGGVIFRHAGDNTVTLSGGAKVSGGVRFHRTGDNTVTLSGGAKVSGGVRFNRTGDNTVTLSGGAKVSGGVRFNRTGDNTVTLSGGAKVSGGVSLSDGDDTLTVGNGAAVIGNVNFDWGGDRLKISGGTLSGDVYFRGGGDRINFGPGLSELSGKVTNGGWFAFESGAVARIAHTNSLTTTDPVNSTPSLIVEGGAVAILDNAGLAHSFDSIFLKQGGTLNIADGVAGSSEESGTFSSNTALSLNLNQEFSGTLIIDANFDEAWADGLAWKGSGSRTWKGTAHVEPAVVAGRKGGSAAITYDLPSGHFTAPEGFSIVHDAISGRTSIRQDMADGACTSSGSGAFACTDLIHETQSLSATGEALNVTLDRAGVVHALAGSRRGLSLSQSGTGGISLTQSSTGSRIAAAGHAVHARNTGAGGVSVTLTGLVVGGRTGRVADADGIVAENGADGSGVRISAASVAGLRHGIAALAGAGGVSVEASGPVTGWFGDGVRAIANGGDVTVKAASASGGSAGILGSGTGAVSIRASGAAMATGSGGVGIDGLASGSGALSISATAASGGAFGIRAVSQGSGSVSVTASGMVKAMGAEGAAIHGFAAGGGALSISAAGASGGNFGVKAVGSGPGSVSVSASGGVSSMNGASRHGVHARASGTGGLTVSVDGDVRGGETGITALGGEGGDVAVTTSGGVAFGGGSVDGAAGIHAAARNGDLTVSASGEWHDAIVGFGDGIRVASSGTGAVSVSATVKVLVKNGDGIRVRRTQAGSVGISVSSLTAASRLPGAAGTAAAISADAPSGSSVTIALNSGAHLMMPGADAVIGGAGDAAVAVKPGATVQGRISLGSGADTLVFEGGALSGVERIDGGAGKDTLMFTGGSGTLHASVQSEGLKGWERIVVESGASLSGGIRLAADSGSLEFRGSAPSGALDGGSGKDNFLGLFNVGTASVPASDVTGWETIAIGAGSEISFGRGSTSLTTRTLNLEKGGTLNVGKDADTGDALTVSGDFGGGGTVVLDANFMPGAGASDRLTVTGDVRGETSVVVAKVGERGTVDAAARPQRIDGVISVGGAVAVGAFSLGSPIKFGTVGYSLAFDPENREFDLLRIDAADGDSGALSLGAVGLHSGPAATAALHSGPVVAAALHMGPAAAPAQATASAGPGLGGAVRPACAEAPSGSGAFSCGGDGVSSPQRLGATGATALSVKLDTRTEVETNGTAFSLTQSGTGGIAFERKEGGAAIRAKGDAIAARNAGGGFVSISARGAIAAGGDGVSAISDADGEGVRIDVATVAAGGDGVSVEAAAGGVSVTADDVKGGVAGIRVRTGDGGTGVEISAGSAEGGADGISVDHGGGGEVRISATGAVSGARGDGVHARSEAGSISVRASGKVSGGAADGTAAIRTDGASAAVTLESGASVRAAGGGSAVMDGAGAALVTVREGASILGGVSLGAGADELVLAGGDFGGITAIDGGPGRDALRIEAGRGSLPALSNGAVSGVESVIVTGDAVIEGDLLLAEDAGELVFADGARIDGHGRLDGGGGASLSLRGVSGEMDAARLSGWTSLEIGEGSRVTLAGAGLGRDAAESLFVAGTMAFGSDARAGDAFTVEGDFEGGGRVEIDADLAAGLADRLVIEGDVIGTTEIALRDLTPSGAGPSGAEMTVVSVGGEADASAFRLAGGAVARGAFLYDLRMAPEGGVFSLVADGGVSDTGAALRSSDAAIARGLARATTLQARAAARAATSVWARIGSAATFAERGAALAGRDAVDLSARESRSVWMRLHGDRWDYGAGGAASIDSSGFEFGMDLLSRESSAGKWIAGLTAQYGTVGAEAAAGGGVGRQGASGYGVGATLSWLGYGGFYADAQAQAGISDSDFSSDTGGAIRSGVSARTAVAALELGWRVAASDSATIVPQAQISMSGVSGDGFVSGSLDVAESSAASLDGRIGLAAEIALREGYLRFSGSLLRALSELDGTVINGRTVEHGLPGGWAEFAVGGSLDLSEDRVLFLDGTWRTGLGGGGGDAGGASISGGLKVNW